MRLLRTSLAPGLFALDLMLVTMAWPVTSWFIAVGLVGQNEHVSATRLLIYPVFDLVALYALGLYRRDALVDRYRSTARVPMVVAIGTLAAAVSCMILVRLFSHQVAAANEVSPAALAFGCFTVCAFTARMVFGFLLKRRLLRRRLLVVGAGMRAWELAWMLGREGDNLNYDIVFMHDPAFGPIDSRLMDDPDTRILRTDELAALEAARLVSADQIVVAPDERRGMNLEQLLACKRAGFPVIQYLGFIESEIRRVDIKRMDLGWLIFSDGFYFGTLDRVLKRIFDLSVSLTMLIVTAPLIMIGMLAVRLEGPGPVVYRQDRVTIDGNIFRMLKLRTMRVDAEAGGAVWAARNDNRITRVGSILRRTRIDELPQLINILKGEMSFVGPRPERPMFVEELAAQIPLYRERHMVKAGLTGWAQLNYPYGASVDDARSKLSYDLYYVKNFSILFDFAILLQTLRVILWPNGVR